MEYLIRFSHAHETFRLAETRSIAEVRGIPMEVVSYDPDVCSAKHGPPASLRLPLDPSNTPEGSS